MTTKILSLSCFLALIFSFTHLATAQEISHTPLLIHVEQAGTLYDIAPVPVWEGTVDSLIITGYLDSWDLRTIRQFCGSDPTGGHYPHPSVKSIDLSEAQIVPGGLYYACLDDHGVEREYVVDKEHPDMLPEKLFYMCASIERIVLPKYIRSIGIGAFFKCANLKEVVIPDEVTHIYATAFGACFELPSIKLPSQLEHLGNYAFTYCHKLQEISIPDGVKVINKMTFDQTESLKNITLPTQMETLMPRAFFGATGLESMAVPAGIKEIPEECFGGCVSLHSIELGPDVRSIGTMAFQNDLNLKQVKLSEGLETIGPNAFRSCFGLEQITLPNSLNEISNEAFRNCQGLHSIDLGTGVKQIGEQAFFHNYALKEIVLPPSLEQIDFAAFAECTALERVSLGLSTTQLVENPFLGCFAHKEFVVDPNNTTYTSINGILYSKDLSILHAFPCGHSSKTLVLPEEVTRVKDCAVFYCKNLEEVVFSSQIKELGYLSFAGCSNLKKITLKSATPIENHYNRDPFEDIDKSQCFLYVPQGSKALYQAIQLWKDFQIMEYNHIQTPYSLGKTQIKTTEQGWSIEQIPSGYAQAILRDVCGNILQVAPIFNHSVVLSAQEYSGIFFITFQGTQMPAILHKVIR